MGQVVFRLTVTRARTGAAGAQKSAAPVAAWMDGGWRKASPVRMARERRLEYEFLSVRLELAKIGEPPDRHTHFFCIVPGV